MLRPALLCAFALTALPALSFISTPALAAPPADTLGSAAASVTQISTRQSVTSDAVFSGAAVATLGADALRNAHGNFGVNVAAGALNEQSNQLVLASASNVMVNTRQDIRNAATVNAATNASLGERALMGASGNIGVNVAAGVTNVQSNALAIH